MFISYSSDYIKFLNDPDSHGINYDQWKDKKMRKDLEKRKKSKNLKNHCCSKYNY